MVRPNRKDRTLALKVHHQSRPRWGAGYRPQVVPLRQHRKRVRPSTRALLREE